MTTVKPSDIHVSPELESNRSICVRKTTPEDNKFYWYPRSSCSDLVDAFEKYILPAFFSEYAAASAEEDFLETVERAKKGALKPVYELRLMNPKNTAPEIIFEIKSEWPNTRRSAKTTGYVGARLFHGEPAELTDSIVSVYLHCKEDDADPEVTRDKQTRAARTAGFYLSQCRREKWKGLIEQ